MSTPTMNHGSLTQQQQQQQQQQIEQQQINEMQIAHLNSVNSTRATLARSDSTSTMILEEDETRTCRRNGTTLSPQAFRTSFSALLLDMKTSGRFNNG